MIVTATITGSTWNHKLKTMTNKNEMTTAVFLGTIIGKAEGWAAVEFKGLRRALQDNYSLDTIEAEIEALWDVKVVLEKLGEKLGHFSDSVERVHNSLEREKELKDELDALING